MNYVQRSERLTELGFPDYETYLASPRWKTLSAEARKQAEGRCQVCDGTSGGLNVHHRSYERLGTDLEQYDLVTLCRHCHKLFHRIDDTPRQKGKGPRLVSAAQQRLLKKLGSTVPDETLTRDAQRIIDELQRKRTKQRKNQKRLRAQVDVPKELSGVKTLGELNRLHEARIAHNLEAQEAECKARAERKGEFVPRGRAFGGDWRAEARLPRKNKEKKNKKQVASEEAHLLPYIRERKRV